MEQAVALEVDIERALARISEVSLEVGDIPGKKKGTQLELQQS